MEISITRGLAEIKLLEKRIQKEIAQSVFIGYAVGKKSVKGYDSIPEFEAKVKGSYQSVNDLIKRRDAIKSSIVKSNAMTEVTINGQTMTVAEAIERKTSIVFEKELLNKMVNELTNVNYQVQRRNDEVQEKLHDLLQTNFGKDSKAKSDEVDSITKPYLENNEAKVIDPLKLQSIIEELSNKLDAFESEVDFVLSESNTITKISIAD